MVRLVESWRKRWRQSLHPVGDCITYDYYFCITVTIAYAPGCPGDAEASRSIHPMLLCPESYVYQPRKGLESSITFKTNLYIDLEPNRWKLYLLSHTREDCILVPNRYRYN